MSGTFGFIASRRLRLTVASEHSLGDEGEIVRHAPVAEGVGFDIVTVAAFGTVHGHRAVVEIDDVERAFTRTAGTVFGIDAHVSPRAEGSECLSNVDKPTDRARVGGQWQTDQ